VQSKIQDVAAYVDRASSSFGGTADFARVVEFAEATIGGRDTSIF
jgi:hypothetical protein